MNKDKEDQLVMCGQVVDYVTENKDALAASEVAAEQADEVAEHYAQVEGARGGTAKRTKSLTADAKAAKKTLLELLPALLGPLSRIATRLQDNDLLASATLSSKQLRKLRPLAFVGVVDAVLASAARPDVVPELAKQGLTAKALQPLRDALATFKTAQPAARKTINERVVAGAALEELLDALMDEVRQLDADMKAFKLLDRELYNGYTQARKLVTTGGRGGAAVA
ncbi:hypothetical protein SAMN02745146_3260 [Hymenobacter daecheongensis DSM 21074]|uniref:Uncharacterized protein n=1 Tax=Hymenobacter daecheongensis DSM 21074 TaxID=1121955 RepID=A0A1M6JT64_9BACT|nr:hypothetical protein [Hymenobacter daecheongensis]SHJ49927.1 hypothetical protein SAMN02745146_3260 [Hymenobacter daecheongensis DSM 21074]